jgi:hypothetical protein
VFRPGRGLTGAERGELRADAAELRAILRRPAPHETAAEAVAVVLTMKSKDQGLAAEIFAASYLEALENVPLFAVIAARRALFQARTDLDDVYVPTPPEFARLAGTLAAPYRLQLARVERLLEAEEETPPAPRTEEQLQRADDKIAAAGFGSAWAKRAAAAIHGGDERAAELAAIRESILRPVPVAE